MGGGGLLTEGHLGLGRSSRTGEGRGTSHAGPIGQSFQRLPANTSTESRKPSSSRRCNQPFKAFKGPSTISLKHRERAQITPIYNRQASGSAVLAKSRSLPERETAGQEQKQEGAVLFLQTEAPSSSRALTPVGQPPGRLISSGLYLSLHSWSEQPPVYLVVLWRTPPLRTFPERTPSFPS